MRELVRGGLEFTGLRVEEEGEEVAERGGNLKASIDGETLLKRGEARV